MQFIDFLYKHKIILSLIISSATFAFFYLPVPHAIYLAGIITCSILLICLHYHDIIHAIHNAFSRPTPIPSSPSAEAWLATIKAWRARPDSILMVEATQFRTLEEQKTFIVGLVDILSEDTAEPVSQAINSSIIRTLSAALKDDSLSLDEATRTRIEQVIEKVQQFTRTPVEEPPSKQKSPGLEFNNIQEQVNQLQWFCKNHYFTLQAKSLEEQKHYIQAALPTIEESFITIYLRPRYQEKPNEAKAILAHSFMYSRYSLHTNIENKLYELEDIEQQANYLTKHSSLTEPEITKLLQPLYLQEPSSIIGVILKNGTANMEELGELDKEKLALYRDKIAASNQEQQEYKQTLHKDMVALGLHIKNNIRDLINPPDEETTASLSAWLDERQKIADEWGNIQKQLMIYHRYNTILSRDPAAANRKLQQHTIQLIQNKLNEVKLQLKKAWPILHELLPPERIEQIIALLHDKEKIENPAEKLRSLYLFSEEGTDSSPSESLTNQQQKVRKLLCTEYTYEEEIATASKVRPREVYYLANQLFWPLDISSYLLKECLFISRLPENQQWEKIEEAIRQYQAESKKKITSILSIHQEICLPPINYSRDKNHYNTTRETLSTNLMLIPQIWSAKNKEHQLYTLSSLMVFCLLTLATLIVLFKVFAAYHSITLSILTIAFFSLTCYGLITTSYNLHKQVVNPIINPSITGKSMSYHADTLTQENNRPIIEEPNNEIDNHAEKLRLRR